MIVQRTKANTINAVVLYYWSTRISAPSLGSLLACGQFNGEGAAQRVHLICARFPSHGRVGGCGPSCTVSCGPAAVFTVNEQLSNLLGYRNVVHYHCKLSCIHWALVYKGSKLSSKSLQLLQQIFFKEINIQTKHFFVSPEVKAHRLQKVC